MRGGGASLNDAALVSLVRQPLAYRRTDGAIVKLGDHIRLSVKIGEPVWARVNEDRLCTPDAIDLDSLAELKRHGSASQACWRRCSRPHPDMTALPRDTARRIGRPDWQAGWPRRLSVTVRGWSNSWLMRADPPFCTL